MSGQYSVGTNQSRVDEGDCPVCGETVRYCGYVPRIYLCPDCGGERPHAEGVVERDGRLYYQPDTEADR
jgi:uncharacterized protein (DUF983 family)